MVLDSHLFKNFVMRICWGFPDGSVVKKKILVPMQDTQAPTLGGKDLLEKEMAASSSILSWEIPWTGETGGLQSMGQQEG